MDAKLLLSTEQSGEGFYIAQYKTSELAVFSYYVESKGEAVLIDPILDTTVYEEVLAHRHASLKYVLLSHYHADYLSGHAHLKVPVVLGPGGTRQANKFKVKECPDGHLLSLGAIKLRLIHTPGHTPESSCYVLVDSSGKDQVIFSGDTVFLGDVGRPDLACSGSLTSEDLAGWLYESIQKLKKLDGALRIYPGHGSGSACGKAIGAGMFCTLGAQFTNNYGFKAPTKNDFTKEVLSSMPKPPPYFFHDAALNQSGPEDYNFTRKHVHTPLHPQEFNTLRKTAKLVDTRMDVGKGVLHGAYWLPSSAPITSWISLFFSPDQDFIIAADVGKANDIIDRLLRIGYSNIRGYNAFPIAELTDENWTTPTFLKFKDLPANKPIIHLDVRTRTEYQSAGVMSGAMLVPLAQLENRFAELKGKEGIVINCLSGMRSKVAFSILARLGLNTKVLLEEFKEFANNGLPVVDYKP